MKSGIKLIVGLCNPGQQYASTRHNAGAWYVEQLSNSYNQPFKNDSKYKAFTSTIQIKGHDVRLLLPQTFMNLSGQSVAPFANFYKISPEEILVAHDELDIAPGAAKLKQGGGHGGHNGLRDIISKLGNNNNFARLRIGIGHPGSSDQVTGYVLGKPPSSEQKLIDECIHECLQITPHLITGDGNKAMNQLHTFKAN